MDSLVQDLRWALRWSLRQPLTTLVVVATLAIGIGANTAIFSLVHAALLRPMPYPSAERLVTVWHDLRELGGPEREWAAFDNFADWREQAETFDGMAAFSAWFPTVTGAGEPERLQGAAVSHGMLAVLGIEPALGRSFRADEDAAEAEPVALIAHPLWVGRFAADPDIVGRPVTLDGTPFTVIGVLPAAFELPLLPDRQILRPLGIDATNSCGRGCYTLRVVGRLAPQTTLAAARAEMDTIADRLERAHPEDNAKLGIAVEPLRDTLVGQLRRPLLVLLGAVALVLLVACTNVANLLLSRATARRREVAIRISVGAGRGRLLRQLLTESVLLALAGALLGILLAIWMVELLAAAVPNDLPRLDAARIDLPVLLFAVALGGLAGVAFGLVPALRASRPRVTELLNEGESGLRAGRLRAALVVGEVALALVLLAGAGLLLRSFWSLIQVDLGFRPERLLVMTVGLPDTRYPDRDHLRTFSERILERVGATPGVESASHTASPPLFGTDGDVDVEIEGRLPEPPGEGPVLWYRPVSPGYFRTVGQPLIEGRLLDERDHDQAPPVVLINETAARRFWPGENPIGQRLNFNSTPRWREIVGVVADTRHFGLDADVRPAMYFPYAQSPTRSLSLMIRTTGDPLPVSRGVRAAIAELDAELAPSSVTSMEEAISRSTLEERWVATLLGLFSVVALGLAALGLYGVLSYAVAQRTREIGIRVALGARVGDLRRLVVRDGLTLLGLGCLLGMAAALGLGRFLSGLLFGITPTDPLTLVAVPLLLLAVGLAASYLPARRATRTDVLRALRNE